MKKSIYVVFAVAASVTLFSCGGNSAESLVSQYEKACKAGKTEKAMKIAEKIGELDEDELSTSQALRIYNASLQLPDEN